MTLRFLNYNRNGSGIHQSGNRRGIRGLDKMSSPGFVVLN